MAHAPGRDQLLASAKHVELGYRVAMDSFVIMEYARVPMVGVPAINAYVWLDE